MLTENTRIRTARMQIIARIMIRNTGAHLSSTPLTPLSIYIRRVAIIGKRISGLLLDALAKYNINLYLYHFE